MVPKTDTNCNLFGSHEDELMGQVDAVAEEPDEPKCPQAARSGQLAGSLERTHPVYDHEEEHTEHQIGKQATRGNRSAPDGGTSRIRRGERASAVHGDEAHRGSRT